MPDITALIAFENGELDDDQVIAFIQDDIDKDLVWALPAFYGRTAKFLIDAGYCHA